MIRYYCDSCDNALDTDHPDMLNPRFKRKIGDWTFEIIQSYKGTSNTGNLCQSCLRSLLIKAVDGGEEVGLSGMEQLAQAFGGKTSE